MIIIIVIVIQREPNGIRKKSAKWLATLGALLCAKMAHTQPIYIKNRSEAKKKKKPTRNTFDNEDEEETGRKKQEMYKLNKKKKKRENISTK